jgi:hypothetical protein
MATRYGAQEIQQRLREQQPSPSRVPTTPQIFGLQGQTAGRAVPQQPSTSTRPGDVTREAFTVTPPPGSNNYRQPAGNIQAIPASRTPRLSDFGMPDFRDPEYNSQIASLNRALQDFETGAQQRGERYGIDYLQGVRNIGYRPSPGFVAMPNILEAGQEQASPARAVMGSEQPDPTRGMQGQWDLEGSFDPYSAAARGTRGLRDEFAARGTLRGTDFGQTFGEFQNRLNEQLGAMETGRTRFAEDLSSEVAQQRTGTEERRQAAERAAINRAATAQMNAYLQALGGG